MEKLEPLINKKHKLKQEKTSINDKKINDIYDKAIDDSFSQFFKSIKNFKKYKDDVKLLMKEQKNIWKEWVKFYEGKNNINKENYINTYNTWLFNYIFTEIDKENSESIFEINI